MPLAAGTRLGPYEIVSPLGAGGMGEVYRARDTRLGRDVAIKVLPQHLSANPEVRARFEREAKTVSSLNHPNICTLFDVGREGDIDFLVMELVEGETLAQRLARGPLPTPEVLRVGAPDRRRARPRAPRGRRAPRPEARQRHAHERGRQAHGLRPRARDAARGGRRRGRGGAIGSLTQSPTVAQPLTAEGTIVGTFQYMSPEQLEGAEADARSDIWALGCVLYEMATGKRAFEGKSQASLISAIMGQQPAPLSAVAPLAPPALERIVVTALEKDPDERWQSAGDLRRELQWIAGSSGSAASATGTGSSASLGMGDAAGIAEAAARARARARLAANAGWIAAGVLAVVAALAAFGPWSARQAPARLMRFTIDAPPGYQLPEPAEVAFSPDGRAVVFDANDSAGTNHLFVRPFDSAQSRLVAGTDRASLPFWSPDGHALAFFSDGKLRKVALDGTAPTALCDAPDPRGGAWSPNDVILFAPNNSGGIDRVSANGGDPVPVTHLDAKRGERGHRYPQFLPDGKHFLYVAIGQKGEVVTWAASLDGGAPVEIQRGGTMARYAPPGYLLSLDETQQTEEHRLLARRFDAGSLRSTGDPMLVVDHVTTNNFGFSNVTTSADGNLVVQHAAPQHAKLEWWDNTGHAIGTAVDDLPGFGASISPDRQKMVYGSFDPQDLFVRDMATGVSTRLTFEKRPTIFPVWSPDSRRLAFPRLLGNEGWEIFVKATDGSGPDSLLFRGPGLFAYPASWSKDGRWLLAQCSDSSGNYDLWKIPMAGQGAPSPYQRTPGQEQFGTFSPDGNWVVYVVDEGGHNFVYVQSFPDPGTKYQIDVADAAFTVWLDGGDQILIFNRANACLTVPVSTAGGFHAGAARKLFTVPGGRFVSDALRDGSRFLIGSALPPAEPARLEVILGWPQLLAHR